MFKKIGFFSLVASLFLACGEKEAAIEGEYLDSYKIDRMEVRKVDGSRYTVGNKVSQLHLVREGNLLQGVTPLGDTVQMIFHPDSAEYKIMGTLTIYHKVGELKNEESK